MFPKRLRRRIHRSATFHPYDPGEPSSLPALEIGAVLVFAYLDEEDGHLRISVHEDEADPALLGPDGRVPIHVTVEGETVYCSTATDDGRQWRTADPDALVDKEQQPSRAAADSTARSRQTLLVVLEEESGEWLIEADYRPVGEPAEEARTTPANSG
ncbi:hypothetical protein LN042_22990 [Kitasatospora sp. RB6PN24]|uniref:hypothetical protein n=1 Tax=Kitasatospora humi TaxID=2893891 RepID=UPI001E3294DD|nr:hypothetical protein [Kitasatospora humi]MCC9309902.1 hypothetical protein [Kitasatospora humi]